jgi:hypothetical protein
MIDNYTYNSKPSPRGALQIELQSRETERRLAILRQDYEMNATVSAPARSTNPLKKFLAALFSGTKTQDRGYVGNTQITLANNARK